MRQLGILRSGEDVFDRPKTHLDESLRKYLQKALSQTSSQARSVIESEVSFDQPIGSSRLVETTSDDEIVYAKRFHRRGLSRFVLGKKGRLCSTLYFKLIRSEKDKAYILITAFIGTKTPPEPMPGSNSAKLKEFWSKHALVFEEAMIVSKSLTTEVPPEYKKS